MGSNYPQYAHSDGQPHVQNIYHHNNTQNLIWGNDREMMTCDGGGGVYYGPATSAGTEVTLAAPAAGPQPGGAVCVLSGTGTGQCRRAIKNGATNPSGPVTPRSPVAVVPCGAGTHHFEWRVPMGTPGLLQLAVASNISVVVNCDPVGGTPTGCGAELSPEPLDMCGNFDIVSVQLSPYCHSFSPC